MAKLFIGLFAEPYINNLQFLCNLWRQIPYNPYKSNHPLLEAFTEYNRLVKARYLLSYIDDPELRSHVQKALNRGEAYHQLRRAISQVNGDRFRISPDCTENAGAFRR